MLDDELKDILVCPKCKGEIEYQKDPEYLICHTCELKYPVRDDIPVMLIDEAEDLKDGS